MESRVILPLVGRAVEFAAMTFHKSNGRQMAAGRWEPPRHHSDDHQWRTEPEGVQERDAADGGRETLPFRGLGGGGLPMGAGPPERALNRPRSGARC
jgi:hypothetical protein